MAPLIALGVALIGVSVSKPSVELSPLDRFMSAQRQVANIAGALRPGMAEAEVQAKINEIVHTQLSAFGGGGSMEAQSVQESFEPLPCDTAPSECSVCYQYMPCAPAWFQEAESAKGAFCQRAPSYCPACSSYAHCAPNAVPAKNATEALAGSAGHGAERARVTEEQREAQLCDPSSNGLMFIQSIQAKFFKDLGVPYPVADPCPLFDPFELNELGSGSGDAGSGSGVEIGSGSGAAAAGSGEGSSGEGSSGEAGSAEAGSGGAAAPAGPVTHQPPKHGDGGRPSCARMCGLQPHTCAELLLALSDGGCASGCSVEVKHEYMAKMAAYTSAQCSAATSAADLAAVTAGGLLVDDPSQPRPSDALPCSLAPAVCAKTCLPMYAGCGAGGAKDAAYCAAARKLFDAQPPCAVCKPYLTCKSKLAAASTTSSTSSSLTL